MRFWRRCALRILQIFTAENRKVEIVCEKRSNIYRWMREKYSPIWVNGGGCVVWLKGGGLLWWRFIMTIAMVVVFATPTVRTIADAVTIHMWAVAAVQEVRMWTVPFDFVATSILFWIAIVFFAFASYWNRCLCVRFIISNWYLRCWGVQFAIAMMMMMVMRLTVQQHIFLILIVLHVLVVDIVSVTATVHLFDDRLCDMILRGRFSWTGWRWRCDRPSTDNCRDEIASLIDLRSLGIAGRCWWRRCCRNIYARHVSIFRGRDSGSILMATICQRHHFLFTRLLQFFHLILQIGNAMLQSLVVFLRLNQ